MTENPRLTPTRKARNQRQRELRLHDLDDRVTRLEGLLAEERQARYDLLQTVQTLRAAVEALRASAYRSSDRSA